MLGSKAQALAPIISITFPFFLADNQLLFWSQNVPQMLKTPSPRKPLPPSLESDFFFPKPFIISNTFSTFFWLLNPKGVTNAHRPLGVDLGLKKSIWGSINRLCQNMPKIRPSYLPTQLENWLQETQNRHLEFNFEALAVSLTPSCPVWVSEDWFGASKRRFWTSTSPFWAFRSRIWAFRSDFFSYEIRFWASGCRFLTLQVNFRHLAVDFELLGANFYPLWVHSGFLGAIFGPCKSIFGP